MTRHHELEVGLNACGVEVCPYASHRQRRAVASYLHRPGDEDEPRPGRRAHLTNSTADDDDRASRARAPPDVRAVRDAEAHARHLRAEGRRRRSRAATQLATPRTRRRTPAALSPSTRCRRRPTTTTQLAATQLDVVRDRRRRRSTSRRRRCAAAGAGSAAIFGLEPGVGRRRRRILVVARRRRRDGGARILAARVRRPRGGGREGGAHDRGVGGLAHPGRRSGRTADLLHRADDAPRAGTSARPPRSPPAFNPERTVRASRALRRFRTISSSSPPGPTTTGSAVDWPICHRAAGKGMTADCGGGTAAALAPGAPAIACAAMGGGVAIVDQVRARVAIDR